MKTNSGSSHGVGALALGMVPWTDSDRYQLKRIENGQVIESIIRDPI